MDPHSSQATLRPATGTVPKHEIRKHVKNLEASQAPSKPETPDRSGQAMRLTVFRLNDPRPPRCCGVHCLLQGKSKGVRQKIFDSVPGRSFTMSLAAFHADFITSAANGFGITAPCEEIHERTLLFQLVTCASGKLQTVALFETCVSDNSRCHTQRQGHDDQCSISTSL